MVRVLSRGVSVESLCLGSLSAKEERYISLFALRHGLLWLRAAYCFRDGSFQERIRR